MRPARKARSENSPPRARRAPSRQISAITASLSGAEAGSCTSARGPPVGPSGPGQCRTSTGTAPHVPASPWKDSFATTIRGRSPGLANPPATGTKTCASTPSSPAPESRTTARAPAPLTVAGATINSSTDHMGKHHRSGVWLRTTARQRHAAHAPRGYGTPRLARLSGGTNAVSCVTDAYSSRHRPLARLAPCHPACGQACGQAT